MSNELFTSMRNQLMPSDDCVNDLLAKIAALDAAEPSEQAADNTFDNTMTAEAFDNVVSFVPAYDDVEADDEYKVVQKNPKRGNKKRVWGLSTVALASAIALVSVFTMIGDDPADMQTSLNNVINNQDVVMQNGEEQQNPVIADEKGNAVVSGDIVNEEGNQQVAAVDENQAEAGEAIEADDKNGAKGSKDKDKNKDKDTNKNKGILGIFKGNANDEQGDAAANTSVSGTDPSQGTEQTPAQVQTPVQTQPPVQSQPPVTSQVPVNVTVTPETTEGKIIPSEATENELTWTKEILSDSAVKQITVQGSNYVVDAASTAVTTSSPIKTLSLSVPETETTAADTVEANALKVANVSTDLAVAVDVNEYQGTLVYLNSSYEPNTLGQFVKDAGITSGTDFTSIIYTGERIGYSSGKRINKDIKSLVVDTLFVNDAPKGRSSEYNAGTEKVVFVSEQNPTGTKITFGVSNSGYFRVVMSNGNVYTFKIGETAANGFIDQILSE